MDPCGALRLATCWRDGSIYKEGSVEMNASQIVATVAAVLIGGVAIFQVALAVGAPYGDAVFGGKAPTNAGVLTRSFRVLAVVQATVLVLLAWILLARTELVGVSSFAASSLTWMTWVVFAFLVLNTAANFSAPHPIERWVMGPVTLVLSALTLLIALSA